MELGSLRFWISASLISSFIGKASSATALEFQILQGLRLQAFEF